MERCFFRIGFPGTVLCTSPTTPPRCLLTIIFPSPKLFQRHPSRLSEHLHRQCRPVRTQSSFQARICLRDTHHFQVALVHLWYLCESGGGGAALLSGLNTLLEEVHPPLRLFYVVLSKQLFVVSAASLLGLSALAALVVTAATSWCGEIKLLSRVSAPSTCSQKFTYSEASQAAS